MGGGQADIGCREAFEDADRQITTFGSKDGFVTPSCARPARSAPPESATGRTALTL
ncbi:hypothetical protein [Serinicoccus marinus]|uniref:hypothetical protein n=1 Tax=Serinicoccus marinus TaxID=247333 RepID=UPI0003B4D2D6|nr:hypothetical protein [Serinicoccus marinus]